MVAILPNIQADSGSEFMVLQEFGRDVHSGIQGNSEFSTYYSENVENPESDVNQAVEKGGIVEFQP